MKTKPILFSTPMVRAILEGRKTQTRRIIKHFGNCLHFGKLLCHCGLSGEPFFKNNKWWWILQTEVDDSGTFKIKCPYQKDDILFVRETWRIVGWNDGEPFKIQFKDGVIINNIYLNEERAIDYNIQCTDQCIEAGLTSNDDGYFHFDIEDCPTKWRPSIFMPKEAARIFLKVTNVRVARLHDISENDIKNEGIIWEHSFANEKDCSDFAKFSNYFDLWKELWIKIYDLESWKSNPFVWVHEFERIEKPENFI